MKTSQSSISDMAKWACAEIAEVIGKVDRSAADSVVDAILGARRIALYGVGREGLMMKAFGMRLFHLGLDAHIVGDMTTPHLGAGDLLIVSAGPGDFSTVSALLGVAKRDGARTLCVTAQPQGAAPRAADLVLHLPAQTMADDLPADAGKAPSISPQSILPPSILPMGSLYEGVQYILFELLVLRLRERLGRRPEDMRANHTNLE